jgi:hypothetical protein
MLYLLLSDDYAAWEHRVGSFFTTCPHCRQQAWQLTFRMYQTRGTMAQPPGPYDAPMNERFQIRCATCGGATQVNHPQTWVPTLGTTFNQENHAVTKATPAYFAIQPQPPR